MSVRYIDLSNELCDTFSNMASLFVVQEIPDCDIPKEMNIYNKKTGRTTLKGTKRLLGVMKVEKIFQYTSLIKWYLQHGLWLTAVHQLVELEPGKLF